MKKTYTKPELFCEEYELNTAIAGNCGNKLYQDSINSNSYLSCTIDMGDGDFMFTTGRCNVVPEESDSLCYEHFGTSATVFNS